MLRIYLLLTLFSVKYCNAQNNDSSSVKENGWIEQTNKSLSVKLAITNHVETFSVNTDYDDYVLYPNTAVISKLSVNYRMFSFSYTYTPRFFKVNNDDEIRGKTRNFGIGFGFNIHRLFNELSYDRTKGYYLQNTKDFNTGWRPGDPYIKFPDLVVSNFQGIAGYKFNNKFSQIALNTQTERQLKGAGSFIPKLYYRYYIINDKSASATTQKSNNIQVILGAGYHYTFVLKEQFYISAGLTPGFGYIFTRLLIRNPTGNGIYNSTVPFFHWDGRIGGGYNGRLFFAGALVTASALRYRQQNTTAINTDERLFYQIFAGYRFTAPRFLKRVYDEVIQKVPGL